jgi:CRP-like cAMP-binding protein
MATFDFSLLAGSGVPVERFAAGERIFVKDDAGGTMFVVRAGRVRLMAFGTVLDYVEPGGIFGEMSLIDGSPRSATAIAEQETEVAVLDRAAFLQHLRAHPDFAIEVMQLMAGRLRRMTESL